MAGEDIKRRTKIVCTLGPATQSEEKIEALTRAGMNVARINFSHGTHEEHAATIKRVRAVATRLGQPVAILQDLQGPKIRTGSLAGGQPVELAAGRQFILTTQDIAGTAERVTSTYQQLPDDVKPGDPILLSDGAIQLRVEKTDNTEVICRVVYGGLLAEHQGINLPGVTVSAPALTDKDRADLLFGIEQRVDYVALSFVRRPSDIQDAKDLIAAAMKPSADGAPGSTIPVIAKLEKPEAIERLESILQVSDGIMVARGDLGVEMPLEDVPLVQKRVIQQSNACGLPVITATQMLESMIQHPRPTRAEASDVANAILDGTDAIMLSGETAIGQYPVEAVRVMVRIALATEGHFPPSIRPEALQQGMAPTRAVSAAAHTLADAAGGSLIAVFTQSGLSAHLISKERPAAPIVAFTPSPAVYQRLALWWGVMPRLSNLAGSTEELIAWVDSCLQEERLAAPGDIIVIMGGMPIASRARTNFIQLHKIGES
ncbi:MAG: pyruvate kinase [Ktedonobacterales bacterium]